jgi:tetratricopeptide (TPR) repeat protein/predicted ATPase/serine/threonine protein kinase
VTDEPTLADPDGASSRVDETIMPVDIDRLTVRDLPVVVGRYELQALLGQGGMARVFRAELRGPAGFRKPVALKVIKSEGGESADSSQILDLVREACMGGRLKHPNIVDVYELGEAGGQLFISMELVEGMTLGQLIRDHLPLPPSVLMEIALGMTAGLAKAHALVSAGRPVGLVHCDVKPSNVLVSWDGAVKIADFGIAISGRDSDSPVHPLGADPVRGTPSFMSPEQLRGEELDGRSDLFSMALVVAEMVRGINPLGGRVLYDAVCKGQPLQAPLLNREVVASLNGTVPGLGEVLLRCLAPDRRERYPDASGLLEDLQRRQDAVGHQPRLRAWLQTRKVRTTDWVHPGAPTEHADRGGPLADANTVTYPPLAKRTNLGPPVNTFVGRGTEIAELKRLFGEGARLVTVKGTGGAGKTRVSQHYARSALEALPGGAWFADLTEARSLMGILHAVAKPLGVPLTGAEEPAELSRRLGQTIASRGAMLLVLDNFEQVAAHAATTVGTWQALAPDARFLVTSRESLRVGGEVVFPLAPLPPRDGLALFESRASTAGARLEEDKKTRKVIGQVVARLDGLPLAIELAAARARMMSPEQILDRLSQRFKLLGGARRGDSPRQSTLRGLIDWSWNLLEPWEQSALAQVSVFRDGFFMEAAEEVLDLSAWPEAPWSLDVVGSLLDKSLLHTRQVLGQPRFEMYVSIQEYAAEKLAGGGDADLPDAMLGAQQRHAAWFGRMGVLEYSRTLDFKSRSQSWTMLFCELENLIAGTIHGTPETAAQCCIAAIGVVSLKGPVSLGVDLSARVLEQPDIPRHLEMQLEIGRSRCLRLGGRMKEATAAIRSTARMPADSGEDASPVPPPDGARKSRSTDSAGEESSRTRSLSEEGGQGEDEVLAILEAGRLVELGTIAFQQAQFEEASRAYFLALKIYREHHHRTGEGHVLGNVGNVLFALSEPEEAIEHYQLALDINREIGDRSSEGANLGNLGHAFLVQGQLDEAYEHYQLALHINRERADKRVEGSTLGDLGNVFMAQGKVDEALAHYQLSLETHREIGNKRAEGVVLGNLGIVYRAQGRLDEAVEHYRLALEINRETGNRLDVGINLGNLGDALFEIGRFDEADQALHDGINACEELGIFPAAGAFRGSLALLLASQGQCEEAHRLLETGESQVEVWAEEHAKFLCKKGQVQVLSESPEAARASLAKAQTIAKELDVGGHSEMALAIGRLERLLDGGSIEAPTASSAPLVKSDNEVLEVLEGERLVELGRIQYEESSYDEATRNFQAALEIYRAHGHRRGEGEALMGLGNISRRKRNFGEATDCFRLSLEIHREIGDRQLEGVALGDLGNVCQQQGKLDQATAHYERALRIHREIGARGFEGRVLGNLGSVYFAQGRLDEAIAHYQHALDIHKEVGAKRFEGGVLGNLGSVFRVQGKLDEAIAHYQRALHIQRETGDKRFEGVFLGNLGSVYVAQGRLDEAIEHFQLALAINTELGDKRSEGVFIGNLGDTLFELGRIDEAQVALEKAISTCEAIDYPVGAGAYSGSLALLLASQGQLDRAQGWLDTGEPQLASYPEEFGRFLCKKGQVQLLAGERSAAHASLTQAEGIVKELKVDEHSGLAQSIAELQGLLDGGSSEERAVSSSPAVKNADEEVLAILEGDRLVELGSIQVEESTYEEALKSYWAALEIYHHHGHREGLGEAHRGLGHAYSHQASLDKALEHYQLALDIHRESGNRRFEGLALGSLGIVQMVRGKLDEALESYQLALVIHREIGDKRSEGVELGKLGSVYVAQGRLDEGIEHYQLALRIHREIGNRRFEGLVLGNLGTAYMAQGRLDESVEQAQLAINIYRDISNKRDEGITRGNMGDALVQLERLDEAEKAFESAISSCDRAGFISGAGAFRGSIALLLAKRGQSEEAHRLLEAGESQVEAHPDEHAKFLCKKGQVQLLEGELPAAHASLLQAQSIAKELDVGEHSEVSQAIAELRGLLDE